MSRTTDEIGNRLTLILEKLETIEYELEKQGEDIIAHMKHSPENLNLNVLMIAGLKSTRTSFELLREEIEELHEATITLFRREIE